MRVLLNTTPLHIGGGLQLATNLVREALQDPQGIDWYFALSSGVHEELQRFAGGKLKNAEVFEDSPARSRHARRDLLALEAAVRPDCVFTPYGPAYVKFAARHLQGAANPWVAHADVYSYRVMGFPREQIATFLTAIYRGYWYRQSEMLVVETEYVRQGYARRVGVPLERIAVVPNSCGALYWAHQTEKRRFPPPGARIRLLCFAAPHKHKLVEMLPRIARELLNLRPDLNFEFVTTISDKSDVFERMAGSAQALGVADHIVNIGAVPIAEGPDLYRGCDICFLPTVLECSSATFAEAMAMGLPIITSDLGFLRDVCEDAALYFRPHDAAAAAAQILNLVTDPILWQQLIAAGKQILGTLPGANEKYRAYVRVIEDLYHLGRTATPEERRQRLSTVAR